MDHPKYSFAALSDGLRRAGQQGAVEVIDTSGKVFLLIERATFEQMVAELKQLMRRHQERRP